MEAFINWLNGYIWSPVLVFIFLGIGLIYSIATRFLQVRYLIEMAKLVFDSKSTNSGMSSFQALALSLGSRVGVGTIAGVATAIAYGGPGAVFWMWVTSFFGAATGFIETTLAQVYKSNQDGEFRGGPPYYIEKGLKIKWFAVLFAIVTMIVSSVLLPGVQVNAVSAAMDNAFEIEPMITGIVFVIVLGLVIFGGIKRIAVASEFLVPIKTIAYLVVCCIVLFANITELPGVIVLIFKSAFALDATFGGIIGSAIVWGVKRGVYANAAGVGSETFGPANAEVSHPAKQGLVQAFSVYIDTLILCSATAFMILVTGMYNVGEQGKELIVNNIGNVEAGAINTQMAVESVLPGFGAPFIAISITLFAFTTLLSYYYTSETCLAYLNRNRKVKMVWPSVILRISMVIAVFYSSVKTSALAWALGDTGLGSMAWLNIIALLLLSKKAFKVLKDYERQKKEGKDPVFDPVKIGFKDADFWEKEYQEKENSERIDKKTMTS